MTARFEFRDYAELDAEEADRLADHPLRAVDGGRAGPAIVKVLFGPRIIGGRYFRLELEAGGVRMRFLQGLHNRGRYPGMNWVEVIDLDIPAGLVAHPSWEDDIDAYLAPLADAIPPGGHLMIEYETDKWHATQTGLLAGIPPIATPMGALLFRLGCGSSFKDWYFPEGGQEGSRKLQGNRALSAAAAAETGAARAAELRRYLATEPRAPSDLEDRARESAKKLLGELQPGG